MSNALCANFIADGGGPWLPQMRKGDASPEKDKATPVYYDKDAMGNRVALTVWLIDQAACCCMCFSAVDSAAKHFASKAVPTSFCMMAKASATDMALR